MGGLWLSLGGLGWWHYSDDKYYAVCVPLSDGICCCWIKSNNGGDFGQINNNGIAHRLE